MSLQIRLTELAQSIGADVKTLYANQGSLAALNTMAKSNLVSAINELYAALQSAGIDDNAPATATNKTYSAAKISALLMELKEDILGGASAAYDTLLEIQQFLIQEQDATTGLLAAVANRVRFDAPQIITAEQQAIARENIGAVALAAIGDPEHDFVADYQAARS